MLDWLRRPAGEDLSVEVNGNALPLIIRRVANARRMTLRLLPDGSAARISMPRWGRTAEALAFARARSDWLAGQLVLRPPPQTIAPGGAISYRGERLRIEHDAAWPRRPSLGQDTIRLGGAAESVAARLRRWLEGEARQLLADDLVGYCVRAGVAAPQLMLSNARRRWGSCSSRGIVRINWRLVMAPDPVRRSVVAHEVAHLVHFDHGPGFRTFLAELYEGDLRAVDAWLRREGPSLHAAFG
ncbi:MAG: M48 family metallopeptidase [Novosphingobium sp.]|nr:M48 family metallopeptidase [Novosphingobium sp.]